MLRHQGLILLLYNDLWVITSALVKNYESRRKSTGAERENGDRFREKCDRSIEKCDRSDENLQERVASYRRLAITLDYASKLTRSSIPLLADVGRPDGCAVTAASRLFKEERPG